MAGSDILLTNMVHKSGWFCLLIMASCVMGQTTQPTTRPSELEWNRALWFGTYNRIGHKSSQWDASVRRALGNKVRMWTYDDPPSGDEADNIWRNVHHALSVQCDDPELLYIAAGNFASFKGNEKQRDDLMLRAATAMEQGEYPPILKFYAFAHAAEYLTGDKAKNHDRAVHFYNAALDQIPAIAADSTISRRRILDTFVAWANTAKAVNGETRTGFLQAEKIFSNHSKDESLVYTIEGNYAVNWAWEARGGGWAYKVNSDQRLKFEERLKIAHEAIDNAYRTDPTNYLAAKIMMVVGLGEGFDRAQMDAWYQRAIANNPDAEQVASGYMLNYLEPKWYGSSAEMLAFARTCVASNDWDRRMPIVIVYAHESLSRYDAPTGYAKKPQPKYFQKNPAAYQEIKPVYEEYLRRYPDSFFHRERFALIAAWSGDWKEAGDLFTELGTKHSVWNNVDDVKQAKAMVLQHTSTTKPATMPADDAE
jgi:hypothetical protein